MKRTQAGFTLAEVAVAILIIGVLIGGTLMGMTFYDNTRRTAVYARVEAISRATDEFIGQYSALPGDMRNAQSRLPPCDNVPAGSCRNGNGNAVTGLADQALFFSANPGAGEEDETTLFWYHLQAAGLMGGINGETVMAGGTGWGESHPAAPLRGGYHVRTMAGLTSTDSEGPMKGLFLRW